jgi:hypothetical protein
MLSLFRFNMIHLNPNSADEQFIYLTLAEMKKDFDAFTNYLIILENMASTEQHAFVGDVEVDNARYTKISVYTNQPLGSSSRVLLTETGLYTYKAYGQNSSTNLNASDASVVGLLEQGTLNVAGATGYEIPDINIPDNYIYYQ